MGQLKDTESKYAILKSNKNQVTWTKIEPAIASVAVSTSWSTDMSRAEK